MSYNDFIDERLKEIGKQASFHQMYVGESVPYVDPVIYKNTGISTEESKKKLGLYFKLDEKMMENAKKYHDRFNKQIWELSDRVREIQDMKLHAWIKTKVLSRYSHGFYDYHLEVIERGETNYLRLNSPSLEDSLDLYIEKSEVSNPNNHWIEFKWELYHHDRKINEGRDFLNMGVKLNWSN